MKWTVVFLSGVLIVGPVPAVTMNGNVATLTDEERADCEKGGGCVVIPVATLRAKVLDLMRGAHEQGKREAAVGCRNVL